MKHLLLLAVLLIAPLHAADQFFPAQRCKISAPTGYAWLDPAIIPGAIAVAADDSEEMLVLLVAATPEGQTELSDELIGYLEEGLLGEGNLGKISGKAIEFKDLSAYEVHVEAEDKSIITVRYFIANGFMYQLQIAGCKLPVSARDNLSLVFDRFDFMSEAESAEVAATMAEMAVEAAAAAEKEGGGGTGARNTIIILIAMGVFALVLFIFVIGVRRFATNDGS